MVFLFFSRQQIGVAFDTRQGRKQFKGGRSNRDNLFPGLGIRQTKMGAVKINVVPLQCEDF